MKGAAGLRVLFAVLLTFLASFAGAQFESGSISGRVVDGSGSPIPGVIVSLHGPAATQTFTTRSDGAFRFLALPPGEYELKAASERTGNVIRQVSVDVARNTDVVLTLSSNVPESITVVSETQLLDVRNAGTGTTVTRKELDASPGRNPWAIMASAGNVLQNGNVDGKQSVTPSKGTDGSQTTFHVDGVNITDAAASGASPMYYDFDAYEEMQVTTSSSDPRVLTPGVQLNLVLRRGTNDFRGSTRWLRADHRLQSAATIPDEARSYLGQSNHVGRIDDWGLELGGPLLSERFWAWGAYSGNRIDLLPAAAVGAVVYRDDATLRTSNVKLNAQLLPSNEATAVVTRNEKRVDGRFAGPLRPPETTVRQSGPSTLYKIEDTQILSERLYLNAVVSRLDAGFRFDPAGGMERDVWIDPSLVWHNSAPEYVVKRPQHDQQLNGSAFVSGGGFDHELKFGFGYRSAPVHSLSVWPGTGNQGEIDAGNSGYAYLIRQSNIKYRTDYRDAFVSDTLLGKNVTLQVGARYDIQSGRNVGSSVPANSVVPDLLPAVSYPGDAKALRWRTLSPRVGLTYLIPAQRRTVLRTAWNRYDDQLGSTNIAKANPYYNGYLLYYWNDANADRVIQRDEILFDQGVLDHPYIDLNDPAANASPYRIDYDMKPTTTDEVIAGIETELTPGFTIALDATHRLRKNLTWIAFEKTRGAGDYYTSADYVLAGTASGQLPDGTPYSVPYYRLAPGIDVPNYAVVTNRPDYSQRYNGAELSVTERVGGRWITRANVSWNDWTQNVGSRGFVDPTEVLDDNGCNRCNGSPVVINGSSGAGLNARWSYSVTSVVDLPRRFTAAASVSGREGYVVSYYHSVDAGDGLGRKSVLVEGSDPARLPNAFELDLRGAKEFTWRGAGLTFSADVFNVTNRQQESARIPRLYLSRTRPNPAANHILALQSPRLLRLGLRVNF